MVVSRSKVFGAHPLVEVIGVGCFITTKNVVLGARVEFWKDLLKLKSRC